ncbi:hypothetical protein evm_004373 [Chilo suppressalis]|nr:hypothetical protein evm_004373 [Chilo suppressalis]
MNWTNDVLLEFLNLYENEPVLWDSSSPQHKNKIDVHSAWLRIKTKFQDGNVSISVLKKKKENLMSTYRKLNGKIKKSMKTRSGSEEIYKPEWPFYNVMAKFMDGIYKPRNTKTTIIISDESEDEDECNEPKQNSESSEEDIFFKLQKKERNKIRKKMYLLCIVLC